jgi:hypothetical protein
MIMKIYFFTKHKVPQKISYCLLKKKENFFQVIKSNFHKKKKKLYKFLNIFI